MKPRVAITACAALLISSCGLMREPATPPSDEAIDVNMQEAADQADLLLDRTFDAVKPSVSWTHAQTTTAACTSGATESVSKGTVLRRRTVLTIISPERRGSFLGLIERDWKSQGHRITSVNRDKEHPAIFAESENGFTVNLTFGSNGQAFFEAVTPCADESKVGAPASEPNGPIYYDRRAPAPNVESDFWSAGAPA